MYSATVLFFMVTLFSVMLLAVVREPLSLSLFFSSVNGLVAAIAKLDFLKCAAVFLGSFGIFVITIAAVKLYFKLNDKVRNVKNAQKRTE